VDWKTLIPWIDQEVIRAHADAFREQYNPEGVLPCPIEEIADLQLGINVVPLPGLQDRIGTVGYITSDLSEIDVDGYVYDHVPTRLRWTIAHEVGHLLLHRPLYEAQSYSTPEEWKAWVRSVPQNQYGRLETQANMMARMILIPADVLAQRLDVVVAKIEAHGLDWRNNRDVVHRVLGAEFGVAAETILYALMNENIADDPREIP